MNTSALLTGLLIGVVRERRHEPHVTKAGTRTHTLVAMLGDVSGSLGTWPFVAAVLVVGGYQSTARTDFWRWPAARFATVWP